MGGSNSRVTIELYVDDQGTVKIRDAKAAVDELAKGNQSIADSAQAANTNMGAWAGSAESALVHLAAMVGITLSIAGAVSVVKAGLQEIADFNLGSIATSAMMLSRANIQGIEAQQTAYGEYKSYVLQMYEALEAETLKHFSSGKEMISTFNAFARKGIYASQEEARSVGVVSDAIKLLHGGLMDEQTALHEIRGVLEGHAGIHYRLAQLLAGQIGPAWKEIVKSHIQDGTLLELMEDQFKGLVVAGGDIQQQWMAQKTSLDTILAQIGRGGLAGLYGTLVGSLSDMNDYLREHKDGIIGGIIAGWTTIKFVVTEVKTLLSGMGEETSKALDAVANKIEPAPGMAEGIMDTTTFKEIESTVDSIYEIFTKPILWVTDASNSLKIFTNLFNLVTSLEEIFDKAVVWSIDPSTPVLESAKKIVDQLCEIFSHPITWVINTAFSGAPAALVGYGSEGGGSVNLTKPDQSLAAQIKRAQQHQQDVYPMQVPGIGLTDVKSVGFAPEAPPWSPPQGAAGKGGKGGDGALNSMQSLVDRLQQDISKLSEDASSAVDAWAIKTQNDIAKLVAKGADGSEALKLLDIDVAAKKQKLYMDTEHTIAKESGNTYVALEDQANQWLRKAGGNIDQIMALWAIYNEKTWEMDVKHYSDRLTLDKSFYDQAAQLTPVLGDQLALKQQSLNLEIKLADYALAVKLAKMQESHDISAAQADEYRGNQALINQMKQYALDREKWATEGISGYAKSWGTERVMGMDKAGLQEFKSLMTSAESWLGDTLGKSAYDSMTGKKDDFKKLWQDIMGSALTYVFKQSAKTIFDTLGKLAPKQESTTGAGSGLLGSTGAGMSSLSQIAKLQQQAAEGSVEAAKLLNASAGNLTGSAGGLSTSAGDQTAASALSSTQFGLAAGGLLLAGIGVATGSQALIYAGMVLQTAALIIEVAAALSMAKWWHSGGIVAHSGVIVAHRGLSLDERPAILQTGEWVLNRQATAVLAGYGADTFDMLNSGRLPVATVPVPVRGAPGSPGSGGNQVTIHINGDINVPVHQQMTDADADNMVRRYIVPAIDKELGRYAKRL